MEQEPQPIESQETPEGSMEMAEVQEPTSENLAQSLSDVLSEEDCEELASMDIDDALGYAFSLLIENGIEEPEALLIEKGILQ